MLATCYRLFKYRSCSVLTETVLFPLYACFFYHAQFPPTVGQSRDLDPRRMKHDDIGGEAVEGDNSDGASRRVTTDEGTQRGVAQLHKCLVGSHLHRDGDPLERHFAGDGASGTCPLFVPPQAAGGDAADTVAAICALRSATSGHLTPGARGTSPTNNSLCPGDITN